MLRHRLLVAPALIAALAVSACGSGGAPEAPPPSAPPSEPAGQVVPADPELPGRLANVVNGDAAFGHLQQLQGIADRNGGNRESGAPGYDRSVDYVVDTLSRAGYKVETPEFQFDFFRAGPSSLAVGGTPVPAVEPLKYSKPTPPVGVTAPLVPIADAPGDPTPGCDAADFANPAVRGGIVVIRRGVCPFTQKQALAADAGAVAAIVVNSEQGPLGGTLGSVKESRIPTAGLARAEGDPLFARAGTPATVTLDTRAETRTTRNVIAQTTTGRTDEVVMAGSHLDSVAEGPGINDNGSGSAALLETALRLGSGPPVTNAVRFAWWGAEESGLLGSEDYVGKLPLEAKRDIAVLLNFDMVASPNAGYLTYDGDDSDRQGAPAGPPGSDGIERRLNAALGATGIAADGTDFDGRSDYGPFIEAGIPAGGIFTGAEEQKTPPQAQKWGGQAGQPYDPNYHQARDNITNLDRTALNRNAKAMAGVVAGFAIDLGGPDGVPPRAQRQPR